MQTRHALVIGLVLGALLGAAVQLHGQPRTVIAHGTTLPSACNVGDLFFLTSGTVALHQCVASNTWQTVDRPTAPGGLTTQVQFNNSGAFGGSANLTWDGSNPTLFVKSIGTGNGAGGFIADLTGDPGGIGQAEPFVQLLTDGGQVFIAATGPGYPDSDFYDLANSVLIADLGLNTTSTILGSSLGVVRLFAGGFGSLDHEFFRVNPTGVLGIGLFPSITTMDLGIARNAAGVLEINSGTAGTFRDLQARDVIADGLKTTGAATGKKVVCVDTATGKLYASSTGTDCSN